MCTFRNSIKAFSILFVCGLLFVQACNAEQSSALLSKSSQATNSYFPLAVGNSWTYRCSVEGQFQFTKTIRITFAEIKKGHTIYRAEMRVGKDPKPLVSYLSIEANGHVVTFLKSEDDREVLITASPKVGDKIGEYTVIGIDRLAMKTLPATDIVMLENFQADDPEVPEDKRLEWRGRTYGRGIGLVEETDGMGGACTLSKFNLEIRK